MPIYEYTCHVCTAGFEHLARSAADAPPPCPRCGANEPLKQFSTFAPSVAAAAGAACNDCRVSPSCPSAGKGCCAVH